MSTAVAGGSGVLLAALTGLLAGRRAVRPLGEAMELQHQFVADASHELRTPLAVISTRAQVLRRHLAADAARDPAAGTRLAEVDQLVHDTQAMADVVSDLLLSAQLEHTEQPAERVDLADLASEVVRSLTPYAADRGVTLVDECAGGGGACTVDGVGPSLRRSVLALVDNAIAHSDSGSRVEVRSSAGDGQVRVDVVDHGDGVEVADVERLVAALLARRRRVRRSTRRPRPRPGHPDRPLARRPPRGDRNPRRRGNLLAAIARGRNAGVSQPGGHSAKRAIQAFSPDSAVSLPG